MSFHHERRLDRALYHLENLKAEVGAWAEKHPYRTWSEFDADRRYKITCLEVRDQPPADLSLIIGDCIHNFRAALDNLAFELALAHHGGRVPPNIEGKSMFPIFRDSAQFASKRKGMIGGIAPAAQAIIEGLQPYNRGGRFRSDRLWQLNWLDIQDKHRLPPVVLFGQMGSGFFIPDNMTGDDFEFFWSPIEYRAPIARYPAFDKTGTEVNVQITPRSSVGFGQRVPQEFRGTPVPLWLAAIRDHIVRRVIRPLHPFLIHY